MQRPRSLSAAFVKTIAVPGRYGDGRGGHGLNLLVKPTTTDRISKSWSQRLRIQGRPCNIGLGSYPIVTLGRARERALANARVVAEGGDPRRPQATTPSFEEAMEKTIEVLRPGWRNVKTEATMRNALNYLPASFRRSPVDALTPSDVLSFLAPLGLQKPAIASKARMGLSQTFKWAIAQGLRTDNPADQNIAAALPKLTTREHHRALPFGEVSAALKVVSESNAWLGTKLAFRFLVLTAGRSGEVRGATWDEIDLEAATWTIPAVRMKSAREHRIPLSVQALEVLEEVRPLSGDEGLVFPSPTDRALTDSTISKLIREKGIQAVPHGFRSSFRDWCASASVDRQIAEASLGHRVGDPTEAAYLRSDMLELRRATMELWGQHLILKDLSCGEGSAKLPSFATQVYNSPI